MSSKQTIEKFETLLLSDDIEKALNENEKFLFLIIPELKKEKGFDQRNKYHSYDVWNHTIHAMKNSRRDTEIRLILLLHDIGKPLSCQEDGEVRHFKGHAEKSSEISKDILKRLGYSDEKIEEICFFISNHATTIKEEMLDNGNIEKYKKLLYIQYCDASAYSPKYAKEIINNLDDIKRMVEEKNTPKILKLTKGSDK